MSAMVDTLDAQMTDYASDDVFMQNTSDPWNQEDGTMDDDSFNSFIQTDITKLPSMDSMIPIETSMSLPLSAISTSNTLLPMGEHNAVEVEMEEYIEEHEYDMVDDEHVGEIHDVEVHDAQQALARDADITAPQVAFSLSNETSTSIAEIASLVTPEPSHEASRHSPVPTSQSSTDRPPHPQQQNESLVHSESSQAALTQSPPDALAEVPAITIEQVQETIELEHRDPPPASHPPTQATQDDVQDVAEFKPSETPSREHGAALPSGVDTSQETPPVPEQPGVASEVAAADPHDAHEGAAEEGSNPHEISEGVYIEPPPGVLLELPSGQHTYSLFNRPSYSGRSTPSPEEASALDDVVILLSDQPTLFYEPIFSVFEAIRQEEPFHSSSDIRELELMFSFPNLKLVISEDNVYARQSEVSLHEVSMLHDSFGESGPLRVQLQFQPRFIIRFSELQSALQQSADEQHDEENEVHGEEEVDVRGEGEVEVHGEGEVEVHGEGEVEVHGEGEVAVPGEEDAEAHGGDKATEVAQAPATEQSEIAHEEPAEEVQLHPQHDEHPTTEVGDQQHAGDVINVQSNVADDAHRDQEYHEQQISEVYDDQSIGSAANRDLEMATLAEEQEVQRDVEAEEHQPQEEQEVQRNAEAGAHEPEGSDLDERRDGERDGAELHDHLEEHFTEENIVDYVEEGQEGQEEYYEDHEDSDATETPGYDEPAGVTLEEQAADCEVAPDADQVAQTENQVALASPSDNLRNTGTDTLANGADPDPNRLVDSAEQTDEQSEEGPEDDQEESSHDESSPEEGADAGSEHVEPIEEYPDFSKLPELPEEDEFWDDELDGEGEVDASWEGEIDENRENEGSLSNDSSVTLSSKGSKRAYSEVDGEYDEGGDEPHVSIPTPEKRTRLE